MVLDCSRPDAPHARAVSQGILGALLATCLLSAPAMAQPSLVQSAAPKGIGDYVMTIGAGPIGGLVAADYDDDGDVDLFVPNGMWIDPIDGTPSPQANQLYRNNGDGSFSDVAEAAGVAEPNRNNRAALWLDYDGDGDLDLVIASDCRRIGNAVQPCAALGLPLGRSLRLYAQQADHSFVDVSAGSGLDLSAWEAVADSGAHRSGLAAGDVNGDGYLDVLVTTWNERVYLFVNRGDGSFADASLAIRLDQAIAYYQSPLIVDVNADGRQDVYLAIDGGAPNQLWINRGNDGDGMPLFEDIAASAGVDYRFNDMGVAVNDVDNDGDLDLYVTNIFAASATEPGVQKRNLLLLNEGLPGEDPVYRDIGEQAGVDNGWWGWGTTLFDLENDGDVDIAAVNGKDLPVNPVWETDPACFWENVDPTAETLVFSNRSAEVGFNHTRISSGLIAFDHDRDGDVDLFETSVLDADTGMGQLSIYDNVHADAGRYLVVRPRMPGPNRRAIGAVVRLYASDGTQQTRAITAGTSTLGQEPAEAHFGLGSDATVQRVVIEYPGGATRTFSRAWALAISGQGFENRTVTLDLDAPLPRERSIGRKRSQRRWR